MSSSGDLSLLSDLVTGQSAELVEKIRSSLVVVRGSRFGGGAGVIWQSREGIILTNNHVVGRRIPKVVLADDKVLEARILARDPEVDLAWLQVTAEGLQAAPVADSTAARVGEIVFAVGHPWGHRAAVTAGIISHLTTAQTQGRRGLVPIIRTDARLAPGNSGGPLVNAAGEVLGINTMIVGGDQGVAVPSAVALEFARSTLTDGEPDVYAGIDGRSSKSAGVLI